MSEQRDALAARVMAALNEHGRSYRLPRDPSDLAYSVADAVLATEADAAPGGTVEPTYPALLRIDGGIGRALVVGAAYRVTEIRGHIEPSGIKGEPDKETTVIRFDPATPPVPRDAITDWEDAEAEIERRGAVPRDEHPDETLDVERLARAMGRLGFRHMDSDEGYYLTPDTAAPAIAAEYARLASQPPQSDR